MKANPFGGQNRLAPSGHLGIALWEAAGEVNAWICTHKDAQGVPFQKLRGIDWLDATKIRNKLLNEA